jgi:hypothetical protein
MSDSRFVSMVSNGSFKIEDLTLRLFAAEVIATLTYDTRKDLKERAARMLRDHQEENKTTFFLRGIFFYLMGMPDVGFQYLEASGAKAAN